jgi:hypothetical protein
MNLPMISGIERRREMLQQLGERLARSGEALIAAAITASLK